MCLWTFRAVRAWAARVRSRSWLAAAPQEKKRKHKNKNKNKNKNKENKNKQKEQKQKLVYVLNPGIACLDPLPIVATLFPCLAGVRPCFLWQLWPEP
jgi:hypothetical protein